MNNKVKLISITQPLIEGIITPEDLIVYCARVSNPSNQLNTETGSKLLKYCIKHGHWSIFEQVDICFEIKTSRAIAAQILRHKSASFQEFSQRYSEVQEFEPVELRKQGKTNRQVGDEVFDPELSIVDFAGVELKTKGSQLVESVVETCKRAYQSLIELGVAKESARMILPLTTQTTMYMKNNVRNWIHYIELRTKEDTQKEHRLVAEEIKKIFKQNFPLISEALEW